MANIEVYDLNYEGFLNELEERETRTVLGGSRRERKTRGKADQDNDVDIDINQDNDGGGNQDNDINIYIYQANDFRCR